MIQLCCTVLEKSLGGIKEETYLPHYKVEGDLRKTHTQCFSKIQLLNYFLDSMTGSDGGDSGVIGSCFFLLFFFVFCPGSEYSVS